MKICCMSSEYRIDSSGTFIANPLLREGCLQTGVSLLAKHYDRYFDTVCSTQTGCSENQTSINRKTMVKKKKTMVKKI